MQYTAELFFEDCRVPANQVLGDEDQGFKYIIEKLQQERLEVSIKCQASAEGALKEALPLPYAKTREAFGRSIGDFQNTAFVYGGDGDRSGVGPGFSRQAHIRSYSRKEHCKGSFYG